MANQFKQLKKDVKRLSKQLDSHKGLTVKKTFDMSTSVYGQGRENKPYMTVSARGDFKIPVLKLIIIMLFVISTLAVAVLCTKSFIRRLRQKKRVKRDRNQSAEEMWI